MRVKRDCDDRTRSRQTEADLTAGLCRIFSLTFLDFPSFYNKGLQKNVHGTLMEPTSGTEASVGTIVGRP